MRSLVNALVLGGALGAFGCAFDDGEPVGRATFELTVELQADVNGDGDLRTADGYRLALDTFEVHFGGVVLQQHGVPGSEGGGVFDPAHPPEGYAMCHGGHCHADDGRLVSYEDIAAELGGAAPTEGPKTMRSVPNAVPLLANTGPMTVALGPCTNDCGMSAGPLEQVIVGLHELIIAGRVFDATDQGRLPPEGLAIDYELHLGVHAVEPVTGEVQISEPEVVAVSAHTLIKGDLFEGVPWGSEDLEAALHSTLSANLEGGAYQLEVQIQRHD